jgi:hypothetical protein
MRGRPRAAQAVRPSRIITDRRALAQAGRKLVVAPGIADELRCPTCGLTFYFRQQFERHKEIKKHGEGVLP